MHPPKNHQKFVKSHQNLRSNGGAQRTKENSKKNPGPDDVTKIEIPAIVQKEEKFYGDDDILSYEEITSNPVKIKKNPEGLSSNKVKIQTNNPDAGEKITSNQMKTRSGSHVQQINPDPQNQRNDKKLPDENLKSEYDENEYEDDETDIGNIEESGYDESENDKTFQDKSEDIVDRYYDEKGSDQKSETSQDNLESGYDQKKFDQISESDKTSQDISLQDKLKSEHDKKEYDQKSENDLTSQDTSQINLMSGHAEKEHDQISESDETSQDYVESEEYDEKEYEQEFDADLAEFETDKKSNNNSEDKMELKNDIIREKISENAASEDEVIQYEEEELSGDIENLEESEIISENAEEGVIQYEEDEISGDIVKSVDKSKNYTEQDIPVEKLISGSDDQKSENDMESESKYDDEEYEEEYEVVMNRLKPISVFCSWEYN